MRISDWSSDVCSSDLLLPEYYLTRAEIELLKASATDIAAVASNRIVVEFGSGSSRKTPLLLKAIDPLAYVPIDISGEFLRESSRALAAVMPGLRLKIGRASCRARVCQYV